MQVVYTSVTFALIYITRATIKLGMIPVLESLFYSRSPAVSEWPGCDASLDVDRYYV